MNTSWFQICTIVACVWTSAVGGGGQATVPVGDEFYVRFLVEPSVTQIKPDGTPLASSPPPGPYVYSITYPKSVLAYTRSDTGVTVQYSETTASPPTATLKCTTELSDTKVCFRALKAGEPMSLNIHGVTAAGAPLQHANTDTLVIAPRTATMRVQILEIAP